MQNKLFCHACKILGEGFENKESDLEYKNDKHSTMKKLFTLFFLLMLTILAYSQNERERLFLFKKNGEYFLRIEIPYDYDLAVEDNKLVVEVPTRSIRHEASLLDMPLRQSQNEFTHYVAVYDFCLGKYNRFKKLKCRITFDYKQVEEFFSLEFHKFVWL